MMYTTRELNGVYLLLKDGNPQEQEVAVQLNNRFIQPTIKMRRTSVDVPIEIVNVFKLKHYVPVALSADKLNTEMTRAMRLHR